MPSLPSIIATVYESEVRWARAVEDSRSQIGSDGWIGSKRIAAVEGDEIERSMLRFGVVAVGNLSGCVGGGRKCAK